MLGLYSCINRIFFNDIEHFFVGIFIKCRAFDGLIVASDDPEIFPDSNCSIFMIAGDHDRSYTCLAAFFDSFIYFRTAGVDHSCQSDKDHIMLKILRFAGIRHTVVFSVGSAKDSERSVCEALIGLVDLIELCLIHRFDGPVVCQISRAEFSHYIQSAFSILDILIRIDAMNSGHHLSHRVKRCFSDSGLFLYKFVTRESYLICIIDKSSFCRFTCRRFISRS